MYSHLTSVAGGTATQNGGPEYLPEFIAKIRSQTGSPCGGFGMSSSDRAKATASYADGVIIGSKSLQLIEKDRLLT
jgi:tryptophan synthase alpha chain